MKAVAMVAHPDDCVIFAYSYIHNHPEYAWTVCYLTYTESDARGQEFATFWSQRNVATKFLGYVDDWHDIENQRISFNEHCACQDIELAIADQDLLLTHDENGDYGHIHHVFVNRCTVGHPQRVTFAGPGRGNVKYSVPADMYSLDELPMHKEIIKEFHKQGHQNEYIVP
jgi:hypothetical protein